MRSNRLARGTDCAVRAHGLSKRYLIGRKSTYLDTRARLEAAVRAPFSHLASWFKGGQPERDGRQADQDCYLWALQDVSFEIAKGEVVGLVGRNGAGKSVLLRILARITKPTRGQAEIYGRVGSMLEVGTGFHPELTGRENVFLSGAVLGMKKTEIGRGFDEIVAFSGVEPFLDTPVKRYSSGMRIRLAFAVAVQAVPEILIIDEVLAVGDEAFRAKCMDRMRALAAEGRTVLFVSHNMNDLSELCQRALLLEQGRLLLDADPETVIARYRSLLPAGGQEVPRTAPQEIVEG